MQVKYSVVSLLLGTFSISIQATKPACDSPIYCHGDLLHAVQMAKLYPDDKTFVDKPTKKPEQEVLAAFSTIGGIQASREQLQAFVDENFGEEGSELKQIDCLSELDLHPAFLTAVQDPLLRSFGLTVNGYLSTLIRKQDFSGLCEGCVSSMLPLKYQFVVPGGRFREIYYWDTYFTLEGILRSGLKEMAKSNIRCLLDFVDIYGFVPNGARSYYLDRSQPPLLTLMVKLYYEHTNDSEFVRQSMPLLIKEHQYWQENHAVVVNTPGGNVTLNRYIVDTDQPRPESYSVDYELAHNVSSDPLRQAVIYAEMAAGAESGWDYSSRWVRNTAVPADTFLNEIRTSLVVPVELNAILYQVEEILAEFALLFKVPEDASKFKKLAETRHRDMQTVFYDADTGLYYDYFLEESKRSTVFSPASVWPYWAFGKNSTGNSQRAFTYVSQTLKHNPGGIPVTLINSGQQWDWPMAWPPLQYVTIQGALATNNTVLANALAQSYVNSVFCAWYNTGGSIPNVLNQLPGQTDLGHMFEKFNSTDVGKQGGGGEYVVQAGFGWTNGVLLWALDKFANVLKTPVCPGTQLNIVSK